MNKKTITLVMMLLLSVMGVKAVEITAAGYATHAAGKYYLYNVKEGKFLGRLSDNNYPGWSDTPYLVELKSSSTGYTIQFIEGPYKTIRFVNEATANSEIKNYIHTGFSGSQYYWTDGVSSTSGIEWEFEEIGESTKIYKIKRTAEETLNGNTGIFYLNGTNAWTTSNDYCQWALIDPAWYKTQAMIGCIPDTYYSPKPTSGSAQYYLYDVVNQKFFNTSDGALTSTPAALSTITVNGTAFNISGRGSGYMKIGTWDRAYLWYNGSTSDTWNLTEDPADSKIFYISTANIADVNAGLKSYTWYLNGIADYVMPYQPAYSRWALITEAQYNQYVADNALTVNRTIISENKGEATSLISNPTFDSSADGWTGGSRTNCNTWRGTSNYTYRATSNATLSQTLNNMPAGTYKVVATVRGAVGTTVQANMNGGTPGAAVTNDAYSTERQQINLNGVQMPYSTLFGFSTAENSLGWQWATATYDLASDGNLTINFEMKGSDWMEIDDVHLYYMSDGSTDYAVNYSDGIDNSTHTVTCDLQTDNPNKIFTANSDIKTAKGVLLNNFRHSNGFIGNLVLLDGYEVSIPAYSKAVVSTLYRNISAGAFATVCCPFQITGGTGVDGTFYQPESLDAAGILNFEAVDTKVAGKAYLYKATSAVSTFTGPKDGGLATVPVDNGTGVTIKGTFTNIASVPTDDYVLSGTYLYKVNSTVTLAPFRAYFEIPAAEARINIAFDDNQTTGISDVRGKTEGVRDVYYDMQGRRVAQPTKGLYIVNGKKVMIK